MLSDAIPEKASAQCGASPPCADGQRCKTGLGGCNSHIKKVLQQQSPIEETQKLIVTRLALVAATVKQNEEESTATQLHIKAIQKLNVAYRSW